ncbi:uncharacterized protein HaLaN_20993 [Haematococcus lacustris]|uniref:Uncharacterized protein n=1 Tax=Haematococcus lacustris TaxID=44745 RepID=A0A699ZYJ4_HAELA|nr:uncharacterized protein HaLaN_20993 [Haematococcus lacustris]
MDLGLQAGNVISNGAPSRSQWQGEVADLQLGLQQSGMTTPVLVISCSMTVLPGFNMQRIVEHSLVRARDTVGIISLSSLQLLLLGTSGHCLARPADTVPVPLLAGIEPGSAAVEVASRFVRFFCEAAAQYRATAGAARSSHQRSVVLEGTSDSPPPATLQGACTYMLETGGLFDGVATEFCRLHRGATAAASSLETKLPATFYMTAYRRQAGSVLR